MLYGIKVGYVKAVVSGASGTSCSEHADLRSCLQAGARQVEELAAQGNVTALHDLGSWISNVNRIDPTLGNDLDALIKAARRGYPHALQDLARLYARRYEKASSVDRNDEDLESAFALYKRAAEAGLPASAYELGHAYMQARGTARDTMLAAHWLKKARDQGFMPAREYLNEMGVQ